jgi:hypothetical protein
VCTLDFSDAEPALARFNDTSHLDAFASHERPLLWLLALASGDTRASGRLRERFGAFADVIAEEAMHEACAALLAEGGTRRVSLLDSAGIDSLAKNPPAVRFAGASRPEAVQRVVADLLGIAPARVRTPSSGSLTRLWVADGRVALREFHVTTHLEP